MLLDRKIWALASGKGGTGKSVIAASMAAHLADLGFRVVLVDVDLGCANLHTLFGIERPRATLADFIERRTEHIEDLALDTEIPRLRLISGALDPMDAAQIKYQQKKRVIRQLNTLEAEVVILDLATGATRTEVELFCAADLGAMVFLTEPTSVENAYRLLRMLYFHMVREIHGYRKFEKKLSARLRDGSLSPEAFLVGVEKIDPKWAGAIRKRMANFTPGIIVNQVKTKEDRDLGLGISHLMIACGSRFATGSR
jgi:flagellar biosynthesis protein FlhG